MRGTAPCGCATKASREPSGDTTAALPAGTPAPSVVTSEASAPSSTLTRSGGGGDAFFHGAERAIATAATTTPAPAILHGSARRQTDRVNGMASTLASS